MDGLKKRIGLEEVGKAGLGEWVMDAQSWERMAKRLSSSEGKGDKKRREEREENGSDRCKFSRDS
mgnify:CR=1 FL=1